MRSNLTEMLSLTGVVFGGNNTTDRAQLTVAVNAATPVVRAEVFAFIGDRLTPENGAKPKHVELVKAVNAGKTVADKDVLAALIANMSVLHATVCQENNVSPRTRSADSERAATVAENRARTDAAVALGLRVAGAKGPTPQSPAYAAFTSAWNDGVRDLSALTARLEGLSRVGETKSGSSIEATLLEFDVMKVVGGQAYNDLNPDANLVARSILRENPVITREEFDAMFTERTKNIKVLRGQAQKNYERAMKAKAKAKVPDATAVQVEVEPAH